MKYYTNVLTWGNSILCRYVDDDDTKKKFKVTSFEPRIWVPAKTKDTKTQYKTLSGYPVVEYATGGIKDTKLLIAEQKEQGNYSIYGDIQCHYQYIAETFPSDIPWDISKIIIATMDIETESEHGFPNITTANEAINAIAIKFSNNNTKFVFGCGDYTKNVPNQRYIKCADEKELLTNFLKLWRKNTPDIITGWNVKFFDIPYIINRIKRVFNETAANSLSPWNILFAKSMDNMLGKKQDTYDIYGISVLDYIDLYKKFTYVNRESYKLDYIASVELKIKKLDYSQYGSLHTLYKNNWELFIDYNVRDIDLIIELENKLKLIELAITMAYAAKSNFEDVFYQVRMWDVLIYNHLLAKNIVIPAKKDNHGSHYIEGAFVKNPQVGFYNWVVSFDLQSLYPHLIMMYNISPETLLKDSMNITVDQLVEKSIELETSTYTIASNGRLFDKSEIGFLPELMQTMFDRRKSYKDEMIKTKKEYEEFKKMYAMLRQVPPADKERELKNRISKYTNLQMATKISLNSAYGAMGNAYFRYFDTALAEAVTKSGQTSIRWIERKINEYLNFVLNTKDKDYIIAVDTDSVYINFDGIVKDILKTVDKKETIDAIDDYCKKVLTPYISDSYDELSEYVNAFSGKMVMKRESIADRGIWTAKKRYILNVHDSEGVRFDKPEMKIMGIEAIKSSTPALCREKIKEALVIIMNKTESDLIDFIAEFKKEFFKVKPEDIAFPRGCNGITKYTDVSGIYKKGTPIHVRGSLLYNHYLKTLNLTNNYYPVSNGDKVKFIYLKTPNHIHEDVIAFPNELPVEFRLHGSIDFNKQFEKSFLEPLSLILNCIGWSHERVATLEGLFE